MLDETIKYCLGEMKKRGELEQDDTCDDCEFNLSQDVKSLVQDDVGGVVGKIRYCEKGHWKEEA